MWKDKIVEEIHLVREEYAAQFDNDLHLIVKDLRRVQQESNQSVVSFPPRRVEKIESKSISDEALEKVS